jgi:hypothetical protein
MYRLLHCGQRRLLFDQHIQQGNWRRSGYPFSAIVPLGIPAAPLSHRPRGSCVAAVQAVMLWRQRLQTNMNATALTHTMMGPAVEADELYHNAGEKTQAAS